MRALVVGSGGRESALAWALTRSSQIDEVVAVPGNAGIAAIAQCLDADVRDPGSVVELARAVSPHLVVIGPEAPLVAGAADALRTEGFAVFGPGAEGARIEGSKSFAKEVMAEARVATARWRAFEDVAPAVSYLDELGPPYVVKADGLAAGKGVVVTLDRAEAIAAIEERLVGDSFADGGRRVVIEEFLDGPEASVIAFTDGTTPLVCDAAQDYKRAYDDDRGPNTGGMGSYSPVPACPDDLTRQIAETVLEPVVAAMAKRGSPFSGALYAGLVLTGDGPRVLEFNARFGDPETQALLPRLESDFGELCAATAAGDLSGYKLEWSPRRCVAVVLASRGYPGSYPQGIPIAGLDAAAALEGVEIFHAGTAIRDGGVVTAGGRVLAVSATAGSFAQARGRAYEAAGLVDFDGKHLRTDIARRAEAAEDDA